MDDLAGRRLRLLRRLHKTNTYINLSDHDLFLVAKYIEREVVDHDSCNAPIYSNRCKINDFGKEQLSLEFKAQRRWLMSWIINAVIAAIAIAALVVSLVK